MRAMVMVVLVASPVFASGFSFEGGAGAVIYYPSPAVEAAFGAQIGDSSKGVFEIRTRGVFGLSAGPLPNFGFTTTFGYRSPTPSKRFISGNFGIGLGPALSLSCGGGDYCGGIGGVLEISPRLIFTPDDVVQFHVGLNASGAGIVGGNVPIWVTAGLVVGCFIDFHRLPKERK
ncbi:MAG: hypothetical protein ACO1OB_14880 [Archangium sp.]